MSVATPFLLMEEELDSGTVVLTIAGELDVATAPRLRERLEAVQDRGVNRIVLDLGDVTFVDSMSVSAMIAAKTALGAEGRLAVVARHPHVLMIFEIGGLDEMVKLFPTCEEAVAHVTSTEPPPIVEPARVEIRWAEGFADGEQQGERHG